MPIFIYDDELQKNVKKAYNFALEKHNGQMYGEHPYMYHLIQVWNMTYKMELNNDCQVVAYLHDTLEDTETTMSEIGEIFGMNIAHIVNLLTRKENEKYEDYLFHVSLHPIAKKVKICDILCNLQESILTENERLIKKYKKALFYLATN